MKVLVHQEFRASKKEPFGTLVRRLHDGLAQAGEHVSFQFSFADSPVAGGVSAVKRAVKKFPELGALITTDPLPGSAQPGPPTVAGDQVNLPFAVLAELADGLPRSLPFHAVSVVFSHPGFGTVPSTPGSLTGKSRCGISAIDNWWVNGRMRALQAGYVVDVPAGARSLPLPGGPLGVFLGTLGKPKGTVQFPITVGPDGETISLRRTLIASPELAELGQRIRARLPELIAEARMPHELTADASPDMHPLKPALVKHFKPLGYSCKGGSGTFSLRRRTPDNHVMEVDLDVGTWSRRLTAFFRLHVPGYQLQLPMLVASGSQVLPQCAIGDAVRWDKIVENLAALTVYWNGKLCRSSAKQQAQPRNGLTRQRELRQGRVGYELKACPSRRGAPVIGVFRLKIESAQVRKRRPSFWRWEANLATRLLTY